MDPPLPLKTALGQTQQTICQHPPPQVGLVLPPQTGLFEARPWCRGGGGGLVSGPRGPSVPRLKGAPAPLPPLLDSGVLGPGHRKRAGDGVLRPSAVEQCHRHPQRGSDVVCTARASTETRGWRGLPVLRGHVDTRRRRTGPGPIPQGIATGPFLSTQFFFVKDSP